MAVITYEDVATGIGRPISDEDEQAKVEQWIHDVEMLLGVRLGDLADLNQNVLAYVEREVVIAWMRERSARSDRTDGESTPAITLAALLDPWWSLFTTSTEDDTVSAYSIPVGR